MAINNTPKSSTTGSAIQIDRRARLSAKPLAATQVYGENLPGNILKPIIDTNGMVFPYTPTISDPTVIQYDSYDPVHSNQPFAAFKSVAPRDLVVNGTFTAQTPAEATYCIAAIHFLRSVTKMYFGYNKVTYSSYSASANDMRGTPPPILLFNAYGTAMYYNVPVIITGFTFDLPNDVDYVEVKPTGATPSQQVFINGVQRDVDPARSITQTVDPSVEINAWVPTKFNINVNMQVQNTPDRWRRQFNLNDFRTGNLIKKGGWI